MSESTATDRDSYTWTTARRDLALHTHLTFDEAGELVSALRECNVEDVDPYDATGPLIRLANAWGTNWGMAGVALRGLIDKDWYNGDSRGVVRRGFDVPPSPPHLPLRCGVCGEPVSAYRNDVGLIRTQPCGHPFP